MADKFGITKEVAVDSDPLSERDLVVDTIKTAQPILVHETCNLSSTTLGSIAPSTSSLWSQTVASLSNRTPPLRDEFQIEERQDVQRGRALSFDSSESDEQLLPSSRVYKGARTHPKDAAAAFRKSRALSLKKSSEHHSSSSDDGIDKKVFNRSNYNAGHQSFSPIALARATRARQEPSWGALRPLPEAAIRRANEQDMSDDEDKQIVTKRHTRARRVKTAVSHRVRVREYLNGKEIHVSMVVWTVLFACC
jgi:hypothetical protein